MGSGTAHAATQGPSELAEATIDTDEQPQFADQASLDYMQTIAEYGGALEALEASDPLLKRRQRSCFPTQYRKRAKHR
jgi:hypothetical protein